MFQGGLAAGRYGEEPARPCRHWAAFSHYPAAVPENAATDH
jgi:hypothetical protein